MPARQHDEQQLEDAVVPSLAQTVRRADSRAQVVEGESSSGVEAAPDSAAGVAARVPVVPSTTQSTTNGAAVPRADPPAAAAVEQTEPTEHELKWTKKFLDTCRIKNDFSCGKCRYCTKDGAAERKKNYIPLVIIDGVSCLQITESTMKSAGKFKCTVCGTTGSAATNGVTNIFAHMEGNSHGAQSTSNSSKFSVRGAARAAQLHHDGSASCSARVLRTRSCNTAGPPGQRAHTHALDTN